MPDKPNTERPQRIELGNGCYWEHRLTCVDWCGNVYDCFDNKIVDAIPILQAKAFAAAMAPQEAAGSMDGLREALVDAVKIARSHAMDWNVYKGPGKEFNEAKRDACLELARELENLMGGRAPL